MAGILITPALSAAAMKAYQLRFFRRERDEHPVAHHRRALFRVTDISKICSYFLEKRHPQVPVLHLPAHKDHGDLHLVMLLQEFPRMFELDLQVMIADTGTDANFFQLTALLFFPRFPFSFFLIITELGEINDLAYGRIRHRRHFNQVESLILCHLQRFTGRRYAYLRSNIVDKPNLRYSDLIVDAESLVYGSPPLTFYSVLLLRS